MQLSGAFGCGRWSGALLLPRGKQASESILTTRPLRTTFGRDDLIDADARIRLAMQACRALTSVLL